LPGAVVKSPSYSMSGTGNGVVVSTGGSLNLLSSTAQNICAKFDSTGALIATDCVKTTGYFTSTSSTVERWYGPSVNVAAPSNANLSANTMVAVPLYLPRGGTISGMAFSINTGSAPYAGITCLYDSISDLTPYPGKLLLSGNNLSTGGTGPVVSTVTYTLPASNKLYFTTVSSSGTPQIKFWATTMLAPILGLDPSLTGVAQTGWTVARNHDGTCPANYPANAVPTVAAPPAVFFRFSQ